MTDQQPVPVLSIKMVPAGVSVVLNALGRMPHDDVAPLIAEIRGQAEFQLQELTKPAAEAAPTDASEGGSTD